MNYVILVGNNAVTYRSTNTSTLIVRIILPFVLLCVIGLTSELAAQDTGSEGFEFVDDSRLNQGYDWTVKVVWVDQFGKKQRTKGRVLLAHGEGIMIREASPSGRSRQRSIPARSIIKLKYRPGDRAAGTDALLGALDGALNGGPIQISTGNFYFDLLSGAVTGAMAGLFSNPRDQRIVWVNRDSRIYRDRVLPELGFTSSN